MFKQNILILTVQVLFLVALFSIGNLLVENNKNAIAGNKALLESQEKIHKDQMILLNEIKNK